LPHAAEYAASDEVPTFYATVPIKKNSRLRLIQKMQNDHKVQLLESGITYFGYNVDTPDVVELVETDYEPPVDERKMSVCAYWSDDDVEDCTQRDYLDLLSKGIDGYDLLWRSS